MQAAREAITADTALLLPALDDPDPAVRLAAAYVLAAAGRAHDILAAVHTRLLLEHDPAVRAGLVLAIAQLSRAHQDTATTAWMRACWSDPARPPEIRVSAALGWLCLTDDPVPDTLRTMRTGLDHGARRSSDRSDRGPQDDRRSRGRPIDGGDVGRGHGRAIDLDHQHRHPDRRSPPHTVRTHPAPAARQLGAARMGTGMVTIRITPLATGAPARHHDQPCPPPPRRPPRRPPTGPSTVRRARAASPP
ncbi:HEAT repeat domain-containing protein [Kitasatospora sp. NPDC059599]|uniref:HEAT repeat domain-containing protein n=1 Tax=Kitasatospora sp. NPDC059599 TaxID=3346880 RepID=UPI0036B42FD9